MKAKIEVSPTGYKYIAVSETVDWQSSTVLIHKIMIQIGATDIFPIANDEAVSVDTKWWEFTYKFGKFRIVYEDWPQGLSIEPRNRVSNALLQEIILLIKNI
ncbi:hypothetical protein IHE31_06220 [Mycetohabitans rhizoxinica]|uniref:hypothetical protein n=1 Tax=Mycetohabitans rhizoxinica TaxID=412963 RepID=UPI0030CEEB18